MQDNSINIKGSFTGNANTGDGNKQSFNKEDSEGKGLAKESLKVSEDQLTLTIIGTLLTLVSILLMIK